MTIAEAAEIAADGTGRKPVIEIDDVSKVFADFTAVDHREPPCVGSIGTHTARSSPNHGAALGRIQCREHHQSGIVDDAVRIFEGRAEWSFQRVADRMMRDVEGRRCRQAAPAGEAVVEEQADAQQPWWALVGMRRDHEAHRPNQMRRDPQPGPALGQRSAHPSEAAPFQDREIAVDQPRCCRGRRTAQIALLQQDDPQAAAGGIAREADTIQAAADDRKVVVRHEAVVWEQKKRPP
jgi:hypothetical protein